MQITNIKNILESFSLTVCIFLKEYVVTTNKFRILPKQNHINKNYLNLNKIAKNCHLANLTLATLKILFEFYSSRVEFQKFFFKKL